MNGLDLVTKCKKYVHLKSGRSRANKEKGYTVMKKQV